MSKTLTREEVVMEARLYMTKRTMTREKFAEICGMSLSNMNNIINKGQAITPKMLDVLNLDITYRRK
jgi:plasmid maintenance system antidote protein VapI